MLTVYSYKNCSTCREALRWLAEHGLPHTVKEVRENPPTVSELRTALKAYDGDLRRLFNTAGTDYRALHLKGQLATMTEAAAFELLTHHGNLVKRPFVVGDGKALVGFHPVAWKQALC
ncbi:MAG: hypothetical protein RLZZ522_1524 [Verrucomicrobiota bacterium]